MQPFFFLCRRVNDYNEIMHHFLNCITDHIELTRTNKRVDQLSLMSYHASLELDKEALICLLANDDIKCLLSLLSNHF